MPYTLYPDHYLLGLTTRVQVKNYEKCFNWVYEWDEF